MQKKPTLFCVGRNRRESLLAGCREHILNKDTGLVIDTDGCLKNRICNIANEAKRKVVPLEPVFRDKRIAVISRYDEDESYDEKEMLEILLSGAIMIYQPPKGNIQMKFLRLMLNTFYLAIRDMYREVHKARVGAMFIRQSFVSIEGFQEIADFTENAPDINFIKSQWMYKTRIIATMPSFASLMLKQETMGQNNLNYFLNNCQIKLD